MGPFRRQQCWALQQKMIAQQYERAKSCMPAEGLAGLLAIVLKKMLGDSSERRPASELLQDSIFSQVSTAKTVGVPTTTPAPTTTLRPPEPEPTTTVSEANDVDDQGVGTDKISLADYIA